MISNKESGVAIWYILVAVVLFAALSFSFVQSVSNTQTSLTREQAQIVANEILRYGKSIEQGIQRLITVNGCSENDISFYSDNWSSPAQYDNANSPEASGDYDCFIFHPEGAGIEWKGEKDLGKAPIIIDDCNVSGVVTNLPDIVMLIKNVSLETCLQINKLAGVPMTSNAPDTQPYACNYNSLAQGQFTIAGTFAGASSERYACLEGSGNQQPANQYFVYSVLYGR